MQIQVKSEQRALAKGGQGFSNSKEGAGRGESFLLQTACAHNGLAYECILPGLVHAPMCGSVER